MTEARWSGASHPGAVREANEDAWAGKPSHGLWLVADGVGGQAGGAAASRAAASSLERLPAGGAPGARLAALGEALTRLHAELQGRGGSTVVVLALDGGRATVMWAGDSRAYHARAGRLSSLTRDHVAPQADRRHVVVNALGAHRPLTLDRVEQPVRAGDKLLLCSDGLYKALDERAIAGLLARTPPDHAADALVDAAVAAGARDNVTAVVVAVGGVSKTARRRAGRLVAAAAGILSILAAAAAGVWFGGGLEEVPSVALPPPGRGAVPEISAAYPRVTRAALGRLGDYLENTARLSARIGLVDTALARLDLPDAPAPSEPALGADLPSDLAIELLVPAAALARAQALAERLDELPVAVPVRQDMRVTSPFGYRIHPITGVRTAHLGLDLAAPTGTPILAPIPGKVLSAGDRGGYGLMTELDHGNGLITRYAHQSRLLVAAGETVAAGQVIGEVGTTGRSTGPHLHWEIRRDGEATDPAPYVQVGRAIAAALGGAR